MPVSNLEDLKIRGRIADAWKAIDGALVKLNTLIDELIEQGDLFPLRPDDCLEDITRIAEASEVRIKLLCERVGKLD